MESGRHPLMNVLDKFSNNKTMDNANMHGGRPAYNPMFPPQAMGMPQQLQQGAMPMYPPQTTGIQGARPTVGMGYNSMFPSQSPQPNIHGGRPAGGQTYNPNYPSRSPQIYPPQAANMHGARQMGHMPNNLMYPGQTPYGQNMPGPMSTKMWPPPPPVSRSPGGYPQTGLHRHSQSADQILQSTYGRSAGARSPAMYPPRSPVYPNQPINPARYNYPKPMYPSEPNRTAPFPQYPMQMPVYQENPSYPAAKKFDYNSGQTTDGTTDVTINLQSDGAKTDAGATSESNRAGAAKKDAAPARLSRYSPFSMSSHDSGEIVVSEKPITPQEVMPLDAEPEPIDVEPSLEPSSIDERDMEPQEYVLRPNDYMWLSCLVLWCWNFPLGFIAYCMSLSSSNAADQLDEAKAARQGTRALWISITGIVVTLCIIVAMVTGALSSIMKNGDMG